MLKLDKYLPRVRCTQRELDELDRKLKNSALNKSEFLRNAIFFTEIKEVNKVFEKRVLFLLNNISNNVNQIARYANTKKRIDNKVLEQLNKVTNYANSVSKIKDVS